MDGTDFVCRSLAWRDSHIRSEQFMKISCEEIEDTWYVKVDIQ